MPHDIDIALVRAFLAVVDTGSVTAAARLLNRTQAAVSLQIKRLEDFFQVAMFQREHRRLTLTPAGERFRGSAQRLLQVNDEVWGELTTPNYEGEVRLGVPVDIVSSYIPPVLRRFSQAWPRVKVSLTCSNSLELLEDLERGRIDLTLTTDLIGETAGLPKGRETLRRDSLVWVAAPDSEVHLTSPVPVSIGGRSCRFRPVIIDALRGAGRDWRIVLEHTNQDAVNAMVTAGIAIMAALRDSVPDGLTVLGPESGLPRLPDFAVNLSLPSAGTTDIATELARHVRAEFAQRFGGGTATSTRAGPRRETTSRVSA